MTKTSKRGVIASKQGGLDHLEAGEINDCASVHSVDFDPGVGLDRLLRHAHAVDQGEFGDIDLLEMVFFLGSRSDRSREAATVAIEMCGSLGRVLHARAGELREIPGFDPRMVGALSLMTSTMRRAFAEKIPDAIAIGSLEELEDYLALDIRGAMEPGIRVLLLDRKNNLIRDESYACDGGREMSRIKQQVARDAAMTRATGAILVSRDASSDLRPSRADVQATIGMRDTLESLCVTLHDHVICGLDRLFSMKKEALI